MNMRLARAKKVLIIIMRNTRVLNAARAFKIFVMA